MNLIGKGGNPLSPELIKHLESSKPDLIHLHTMGFIGAQVIRFAKKIRFLLLLRYMVDTLMSLRMKRSHLIVFIKEPLVTVDFFVPY